MFFVKTFVTFWHELCLTSKRTKQIYSMKNLSIQYDSAKERANEFMKKGQIPQYFEALLEMNKCKKIMTAIIAN